MRARAPAEIVTAVRGSALIALADRIPNEEAIALAPTAGWLMLACASLAAIIFIIHRDVWRRLWLGMEDPRAMGLFRIAFGLCAMANVNGLWEMFEYLFTDEGIFLTDVAREVFARDQFQGFGHGLEGEHHGFFGFEGVWQWLKGPKYSLLFFWDSPRAFWIHWAAWQLAMLCLIFGVATRYTKWIAWFLFHSIILRNSVYWEGTENVYRVFFFYLCLSRCGHAYSVDNWLRCRKLRAQGRLSEPGKPGEGAGAPPSEEHPQGLAAIYRLIPAWPRILVILQCAALYCYTGVVKNGSVWWRGDAFYYALNLDHFYRIPPQALSAVLGTNFFRLSSHITHFWESFFPVVVLGLVVRFAIRERVPRLSKPARLLHAATWVALGLTTLALVEVLYPTHFVQPKNSIWTLERARIAIGIGWVLGMGLVGYGWWKLRWRPPTFTIKGRTVTLDLDTFLKWTCGRRIWVFLGFVFHLHLMVLMNIGWFQPGALTGFICFLNGTEIALAMSVVGRRLGFVPKDHVPLPAEDPTLPHHHRDSIRLPVGSMIVALAMAIGGVVLHAEDLLHYGWTLVGIAAFLGGSMLREASNPRRRDEQLEVVPAPYRRDTEERPPLARTQLARPWAYGPFGRYVVACLTLYHIVGVACWLLPDKDSFQWRTQTHEPFKWWLRTTQTTQGWSMFAPNPPRSNMFLQVLVTDPKGEVWDMKTDVYAEEARPLPWIWYTRQRKVNRRIAGGEGGKGSWYQKWHARWFCRQWALEHEGELPEKVELVKITYPIPSPEWVRDHGAYDPVERLEELGKYETIYTARCKTETDAQPPEVILERHGIEPPADYQVRRWGFLRNKADRWKKFQEKQEEEDEDGEEE